MVVKWLIILVGFAFFTAKVKAQTVLYEEEGVSLSYVETYVNTLNCSGEQFEQYKIVAYLKNNSGHTINIGNSYMIHNGYVTSCGNRVETASFGERRYWSDNSTLSYTYYIAIKPNETLTVNTWKMGGFKFAD